MADAEDEITAEDLKSFIVSRGGKVKNVELVTHYSYFLKHSSNKDAHKKRFSQLVNEYATVKTVEGEKFIVLKKKYRKGGGPLTFIPPPAGGDGPTKNGAPMTESVPETRTHRTAAISASNGNDKNGNVSNGPSEGTPNEDGQNVEDTHPVIEESEVFVRPDDGRDRLQGAEDDQGMDVGRYEERVPNGGGHLQEPSVEVSVESTQQSAPSFPPDEKPEVVPDVPPRRRESELDQSTQIESVNKVAGAFEEEGKIQELAGPESPKKPRLGSSKGEAADVVSAQPVAAEKKPSPDPETASEHHEDDEELPHFETGEGDSLDHHHHDHYHVHVKLGALERKWMLASAYGKVDELNNLLKQDPTLITKRDFISGFTVMHWGAKLGKKEMIRMAIDNGVDVNMRTQGGYTALHIAAMHNREAIMQLLTTDYNANIEIRDYSGKKPHHHLKATASSYIKIPNVRREAFGDEVDKVNKRKSKIGGFFRGPLSRSFRSSFRVFGSAEDLDETDGPKTPPSSPRLRSKSTQHEGKLMPPPHPFQGRRSKKKSRRRNRSPIGTEMRRFGSDSDLLSDSPHTHIFLV